MYAIMSDGVLLALCDKPRYVKRSETNGAYVEAAEADAVGVAVCGDLYNINSSDAIPDAPQAVVAKHDVNEFVFRNRVRIEENEAATNSAIIEVENALCDLDTAAEEKLAAMEDALCEIDGLLNGGEN